MKQVIGYLVKNTDGEIIGATGNEREAMYIARNWTGTIHPMTYQNDFIGVYQEVYKTDKNGELLYSPRLRTSLD